MRMVEIDGCNVAALADRCAEQSEVENDKDTNARDDDPAMDGTVVENAQEKEGHAQFEKALVEDVERDA